MIRMILTNLDFVADGKVPASQPLVRHPLQAGALAQPPPNAHDIVPAYM